jgi:hypothetical protein
MLEFGKVWLGGKMWKSLGKSEKDCGKIEKCSLENMFIQ